MRGSGIPGGLLTNASLTIASLLAGSVIVFLGAYALLNDSGHTSVTPWICLVIFLPTVLLGAARVAVRGRFDLQGTLAVIIGMAGILILFWFDRSNVLLQYEVWIERGMP